jgi:hypothetical protein
VITLVSFDIDGTLELGDPPGIITIDMVRSVKRRGYVIGSGSDRPLSYQRDLWKRLRIDADFIVLKHRLAEIKTRFPARAYYHIGDTDVDDDLATRAGFHFLRANPDAHAAWGLEIFGA